MQKTTIKEVFIIKRLSICDCGCGCYEKEYMNPGSPTGFAPFINGNTLRLSSYVAAQDRIESELVLQPKSLFSIEKYFTSDSN